MNLLFVYTSEIIPEKGGVQRVTKVLADFFKDNDINVFYLSKEKTSSKSLTNHYFLPDKEALESKENLDYICTLVLSKNINFIINQAALGGVMSSLCYEPKKYSDVKVLSVIHNSLLGNVDNFTSSNKKIFNFIPLSSFSFFLETKLIKKILLFIYISKYRDSYKKMYAYSDRVILLSNSYFSQLQLFVKEASNDKVISIHNPCTINENCSIEQKKNELLYVGRVNISQKRVDLLLKIWQKIFLSFPDWKLNIVGDGEDLNSLKEQAKKMELERVFFLGYKNPIAYYQTAKIFCMTSSYEGFPLVLAEAQNFNVIPVLFNSFPSTIDIIDDTKNGVLIEPFNIDLYAKCLYDLMTNYNRDIVNYSKNCKKSIAKFSIEIIGGKWLALFNKLKL